MSAVDRYAADVLTRNVRAQIARKRPDCWSDDFSWLPVPDGEDLFFDAFAAYYDNVRAFHGCRPVDVGSYLEHGLRVQDPVDLEAQFRAIFADIPLSTLDAAIAEARPETGRSWVLLDDDDLIKDCGHYLIQGSEYLMALAASLSRFDRREDYRMRLRKQGIPTVLELHIPIHAITEPQLRCVTRLVLAEWGGQVARRPMGRFGAPCLTLRRDIEACHIVAHKHPATIIDPHRFRIGFTNEQVSCPHCG